MINLCVYCHKPQTDAAALCHPCTEELGRLLNGARALADELKINMAKLDRTGTKTSSAPFRRPLPISLPAAEVLWDLASTITTWERSIQLMADLPAALKPWRTSDRNDTIAFVVATLPTVRRHEFAGQMLVDLRVLWGRGLAVIDLPPATVFLGSCETPGATETCHTALYAQVGASVLSCPSCGAQHDVSERRDWLLTSMEELTVTASTARRLAVYLGVTLSAATISDWKRKEWLTPLSGGLEGDPDLYRFGDLLALKRRDVRVIGQRVAMDELKATA